jgi:hypothetical protein
MYAHGNPTTVGKDMPSTQQMSCSTGYRGIVAFDEDCSQRFELIQSLRIPKNIFEHVCMIRGTGELFGYLHVNLGLKTTQKYKPAPLKFH